MDISYLFLVVTTAVIVDGINVLLSFVNPPYKLMTLFWIGQLRLLKSMYV